MANVLAKQADVMRFDDTATHGDERVDPRTRSGCCSSALLVLLRAVGLPDRLDEEVDEPRGNGVPEPEVRRVMADQAGKWRFSRYDPVNLPEVWMNRLYERFSSRCAADALDAGLRAEITAHADAHQLGDVLGDARFCCETRSVRLKRPGLLSRITGSGDADTEHRTTAIVTSRYLVVAIVGEKRGTHVRSIRLDSVSVGNSKLSAGLDSGVSATGLWSGEHEAASFYIGLGDDADGNAFLDALRGAITEAKSA